MTELTNQAKSQHDTKFTVNKKKKVAMYTIKFLTGPDMFQSSTY